MTEFNQSMKKKKKKKSGLVFEFLISFLDLRMVAGLHVESNAHHLHSAVSCMLFRIHAHAVQCNASPARINQKKMSTVGVGALDSSSNGQISNLAQHLLNPIV